MFNATANAAPTPLTTPISGTIDLRRLAPAERQTTAFARFAALRPGQAMQLLDDSAALALHEQFTLHHAGQFSWSAVQSGAQQWRLRIGRLAPAAASAAAASANDSCCSGGACGG